ncbi:MAG: flagellum-specific ATP synthase FliI, partial [Sphaerotilus sp.]|nr:flagellum-specific ATP synthase FliI [Sphaerotilus sp.]
LIQLGAYVPGHDAELDAAMRAQPAMMALLQQDTDARATLGDSLALLRHITRA